MRKISQKVIDKVFKECSDPSSDFTGKTLDCIQVTNPHLFKFIVFMRIVFREGGDSYGDEIMTSFACFIYRILERAIPEKEFPLVSPEVIDPIWLEIQKNRFPMATIIQEIAKENLKLLSIAGVLVDQVKEERGLSEKEVKNYMYTGFLVYHFVKKQRVIDLQTMRCKK